MASMDEKLMINLERTRLIQNGALDLLSQQHELLKDKKANRQLLDSHLIKMKPYLAAIKQTESLIAKLKYKETFA